MVDGRSCQLGDQFLSYMKMKIAVPRNTYNSVYTGATDWRSEQLLSTERSRDLIEAFSYSEKFDNIGNDTDTRETDWPGHYLV